MRHSKSICELTGLKINPHEAYIISEKLSLDRYLTVDESDKWVFSINYEGIIFHRYGGYKQQLKDIKRKRLKDDLYNILVAVGTTLAGFYALWQVWLELE